MGTDIDFIGYSADCRVEGTLALEAPRLADMLNEQRTVVLRDVLLVSHCDGHTVELNELEVRRDELTAVVASGPRGDPSLRVDTTSSPLTVKVGPYLADGHVHDAPRSRFRRRQTPMVAMTNALIAYEYCQSRVAERYPTLLVNRRMAAPAEALLSRIGFVASGSTPFAA